MPVRRPIVRVSVTAGILAVALLALTGCTSETPAADSGATCTRHVKEVLLGDDSATQLVTFDPADSPKVFNLPTSPAPTCAYRSSSETQGTAPMTVVHRSYLYIGISSDDAQKLIAALGATGAHAPWSASYANVPAPSTTPAPSVLQTAAWDYNANGASGPDRGSMSYAYNAPVNPGIAKQVGLSGTPNVLRIETEISTPKK
jgi:hypothetical protein